MAQVGFNPQTVNVQSSCILIVSGPTSLSSETINCQDEVKLTLPEIEPHAPVYRSVVLWLHF